MAVWVCRNCSARYAVGLFRCPQCRSENSFEEGSMPPKITVHGGPSDATVEVVGEPGPEVLELADGDGESAPAEDSQTAVDEQEGGDQWAGTSSSTSSEKPGTGDETKSPDDPLPAPTTAPRSRKARKGSSSAGSTDGNTRATG